MKHIFRSFNYAALSLVATLGVTSLARGQQTTAAPTGESVPSKPPASAPPAASPAAAASTKPSETPATASNQTAPEATQPAAATPLVATPPEPPPPGYLRLEDDYLSGLQVYAGVTYPLSNSFGLTSGIYVAENYPALSVGNANTPPTLAQSWWSEFDIGPTLTLGPVAITLEAGIAFDWAAKRAIALNSPQLYTTVDISKVHFESWIWTILYSPFNTPTNDYIHTRNWLLYKLTGAFSAGPELEFNINLNDKYGKNGLVSLPLGGRVELAFGANTIALFLGYQTDKDSRGPNNQAAVGRFALIHNF